MYRSGAMFFLLVWMPALLLAQHSFEELVDRTFGSDQGLVNGIQFSNQYIRIEGNPYFLDGRFRIGSVLIGDQFYEYVMLRYNLYTQKLEIEYLAPEDHMNQLISVPEQIPAFYLEGFVFRRMQIGEEAPAYYMVLSSEKTNCYLGWSVDAVGGGNTQRRFGQLERKYWIQQGDHWTVFHDRKSYLRAFPPERKKEFKDLLKSQKFYFNQAGTLEVLTLVDATLQLLEEGGVE
jgi:hypothetical protein